MTTDLTTAPTTTPNGFALLVAPEGIKGARELAEMLSKSDLVPKNFANKPGDIMIAGAMGSRLGLDIFSALAGIAVVNGRPTLYGDAMLAVCQQRPDFEDITEQVTGTGDAMTATVTVTRKGRTPYVSTYSMGDAKVAGLSGKQGPWMQHPKRMLTMRARAFALRGAFADALAGFHAREEFDDLEDVTASATVVPEAKPAKARAVKEDKAEPKTVDAVVTTEKQPEAKDAEPVVITDLDKPATITDLVAMVTNVAKEFGPEGIEAIKKLNAHFGVKKTGEIPAERVEEAVKMLVDATGALVELQGRGGK